jgi:hypothetical protein
MQSIENHMLNSPITDPFERDDEELEYPDSEDDSGECCDECGFFHGHFRFCSQFIDYDEI